MLSWGINITVSVDSRTEIWCRWLWLLRIILSCLAHSSPPSYLICSLIWSVTTCHLTDMCWSVDTNIYKLPSLPHVHICHICVRSYPAMCWPSAASPHTYIFIICKTGYYWTPYLLHKCFFQSCKSRYFPFLCFSKHRDELCLQLQTFLKIQRDVCSKKTVIFS